MASEVNEAEESQRLRDLPLPSAELRSHLISATAPVVELLSGIARRSAVVMFFDPIESGGRRPSAGALAHRPNVDLSITIV